MKMLALALTAMWLLAACASGSSPTPAPAPARPTDATIESDQDELVENTREVATMVCEEYGPRRTAKTYGVGDPEDLGAIAEAYSMDSKEGAHQQAAFEGCFDGLVAWEKAHK